MVIVVLGILAAIVVPNISSFQKEAEETAIHSDIRNIQTGIDLYSLDHYNSLPLNEVVSPENPVEMDIEKLKPDYLRNLPKNKELKVWIDFTGKMWASTSDSPKNPIVEMGKVRFNSTDGGQKYNAYMVESSSALSSKADKESHLKLLGTVEGNGNLEIANPSITLDSIVEVSSVDEFNLESAPAGKGYNGYEINKEPSPEEKAINKDNLVGVSFNSAYQQRKLNTNLESLLGANPDQWSYELLFKTTMTGTGSLLNDYNGDTSSNYYDDLYAIGGNMVNGKVSVSIRNSASSQPTINSKALYNDGKWHHLAVTVNKTEGKMRMYIDGVFEGEISIAKVDYVQQVPLNLGAITRQGKPHTLYTGELSEVRLFNYQRTVEEIQRDKDIRYTGSESGLVGYWSLVE